MQGLKLLTLVGLAAVAALVAGCSSTITNLTPTLVPREENGLYHFEAEWTTNQRSRQLRQDDIRAYVVVDQKLYPMERVPRMADRWETLVPIPNDQNPVYYFYRWDYTTAGFGNVASNSLRSDQYRLEITAPSR